MKIIHSESVLRGMLADAKLEPDRLEPWPAWKVFKAFLQRAVECEGDAASFQCRPEQDDVGEQRFLVQFLRQCSATEDGTDTPVSGVGIEFAYTLEHFPAADDREVWSYEFPSLADFAAHVEALAQFQAAMNERPLTTEVWMGEV